MKRFSYLCLTLLAFTLILAACSDNGNNDNGNSESDAEQSENDVSELAYEPEDIDPETDVCDICAMAVADDQFATQIVLENDRALKFDDLGCLYEWLDENGTDEVGAKFVRDFNTAEWIQLEEATYVFAEEIETPMAYGVISFKNSEDAEQYVADNGFGEILEVADLDNHKWEMMDHDHDHDHDHDDHEE